MFLGTSFASLKLAPDWEFEFTDMSLRTDDEKNTHKLTVPFNQDVDFKAYFDINTQSLIINSGYKNTFNITIIDANGQVVKSEKLSGEVNSIEYSNFESGIYFAILLDDISGEYKSVPFIKL